MRLLDEHGIAVPEHAGWPGFGDRVRAYRANLTVTVSPLGADLITTVPNAPQYARVRRR